MLMSHVKHFLNPEGIEYFPIWFKEGSIITAQQKGFISLKYAFDQDDPSCVNIWVEFESPEDIKNWSATSLHQEIIAKLNPYKIKSYTAIRYKIEETIEI